jgi:uncharacterized phiE125 gp8 family phage protein
MRGPKVIIPPAEEPLTIDECRSHLEALPYGDSDSSDDMDDTMILGWLAAAREHCENFLGLSLAERVLEIALDESPTEAVELPFGPVLEILSVTVGGGEASSSSSSSSDAETVDPSAYLLDDFSMPNRLVVRSAWPASGGPLGVRITYRAGYGRADATDTEQPLPATFRAAILLVLGHLFAHREEATEKALTALPLGFEALLRPSRVRLGMA